jgi:hypothetical protein
VLDKLSKYVQVGKASEFEENKLKRNFRLYVRTKSFDNAYKILNDNHFLVVKGEPGVGKTALAELLLYQYIKEGYKLTYLTGDTVGLDKFIDQDDHKQIFYFDDFLGHTEMEIAKAKASEGLLLNFMNRFLWRKNKKLLLTTRTHILRTIELESERFRQFKSKLHENTILLSDYNSDFKTQILINHVEESFLPKELKAVLLKPKVQEFIANHKNFYPRSVEFITDNEKILLKDPIDFEVFIFKNFDKPDQIWKHAYEQQINNIDRWLLNTLLTFGQSARFPDLELAFQSRMDYEVKFQNLSRPMNAFGKSYKRLLGSFMNSEQPDPALINGTTTVALASHSLKDFLFDYLKEDRSEVIRISESVRYAKQLSEMLFPLSTGTNTIQITPILKEKLISKPHDFLGWDKDVDLLTIALTLLKFVTNGEADFYALKLLLEIEDWMALGPEFVLIDNLKNLLLQRRDQSFIETVKDIGVMMFEPIVGWVYDYEEIKSWDKIMSEKFSLSIHDLFLQAEVDWPLYFKEILDGKRGELIDHLKLEAYDQEKVEQAKRTLIDMRNEMRTVYRIFPELSLEGFNDYELEYALLR